MQNLGQCFASLASQAVTASLCDKKALLASGKSKQMTIWIPSDVDPDMEDEDGDEGRDFDDP